MKESLPRDFLPPPLPVTASQARAGAALPSRRAGRQHPWRRLMLVVLLVLLVLRPALAQLLPPAGTPARLAVDSVNRLMKQAILEGRADLLVGQRTMRQALRIAQRSGDQASLSACWNVLGDLSEDQDPRLHWYFEQGLAAARQAGWLEGEGDALLGMAGVADNLQDNHRALDLYERAGRVYDAIPPGSISDSARQFNRLLVLANLASTNYQLHRPVVAAAFCRRALALRGPGIRAHPNAVGDALLFQAELRLAAQHPDSARLSALHGLRLVTNGETQADLHTILARCDLAQQRPEAAQEQALLALGLSRRGHWLLATTDALAVLADALRAQQQPAAYDTLRRYLALRDTLHRQELVEAATTAQARFDSHEQQAHIRALEQDRRLAAQGRELARLRARQQLAGSAALLVLVLAGTGLLLWRYRRRQRVAAAALRHQLAADLHDDVGTLLSQISMQSGVLQAGLADAACQQQQLGQIAQASQLAVRQLNDVVWSLDAHNDTLPGLLDRLRDYAYEVLAPAGLAITFDMPASFSANALPTNLRRHLYLIYKEALHNILKHAAGATQVTVRLAREAAPAALLLTVANDAPGPASIPAAPTRRSGHGLRNMAARAAALGGVARSGPEPGGGFAVHVRLPLAEGVRIRNKS